MGFAVLSIAIWILLIVPDIKTGQTGLKIENDEKIDDT